MFGKEICSVILMLDDAHKERVILNEEIDHFR